MERPVPEDLRMAFWLLKSEPGSYSIDDLARDGRTLWEGIRNYQARNLLRDDVGAGDRVLFYHSSADPPGVAGLARISSAGHPDRTALDPASPYHDPRATEEDPRWYAVEVEFVERFPEIVPLSALRQEPGLEEMPVINRSRLSVQPVTAEQFEIVREMARRLGAE